MDLISFISQVYANFEIEGKRPKKKKKSLEMCSQTSSKNLKYIREKNQYVFYLVCFNFFFVIF